MVGGAFYLNLEFSKIRYNNLLCYSFAHVNLFLARSQLYTPLLVMHSYLKVMRNLLVTALIIALLLIVSEMLN